MFYLSYASHVDYYLLKITFQLSNRDIDEHEEDKGKKK